MKNLIIISIIALAFTASAVQAATITGWGHPDYIGADIEATYSAADSSMLLTVINTSTATSANLRGILFSAPDVTLSITNVSYYTQSIAADPVDMTESWSIGSPSSALLNAEPMKYFDGLDTSLFTGNDHFQGGNPNTGLQAGWSATFVLDVEGTLNKPLDEFIARFQSISYPGMEGSDSDFASQTPTPIPGAVWLFGAALSGLIVLRRRS